MRLRNGEPPWETFAPNQVQQDQSATASGPGAGWLALGHAVQGAMNAGLGEKMRREAAQERQQAADERRQLAELGAEQPPVAQNNSESIALTRMQTQMIQSGNTIQSVTDQQVQNIQALQQVQERERERRREERQRQEAQPSASANSFKPSQPANQPLLASASTRPSPSAPQCQDFPTFITANETTTSSSALTASIQFNIPAGFFISGGQVGTYQGAKLQTAIQEIQQGYQGHDWGVEAGEGDTTYATAISGPVTSFEVTQGGILVGTFIILDNGSSQEAYRGDARGATPAPLALTLMAVPSSCQRSIAGEGAGTIH